MRVHNRVLALLWLLGLAAAVGVACLTHAPNRLVTGTGIRFGSVLHGANLLVLLPGLWLGLAAFLRTTWRVQVSVLIAATLWLAGLVYIGGAEATRLAEVDSAYSRTSFGGGFWIMLTLGWLIAADALSRLKLKPVAAVLVGLAVLAPLVAQLASGHLANLSVLKEYANRQDVFNDALSRHLEIVAATLIPTLLIGVPLGVLAYRRQGVRPPLFGVLNVIQTVPSIALFGLLIAPLAALAAHVPVLAQWGIGGIGTAPAIIALTLYSLLPMVRSTTAGLEQVPASVVDAARGMGLSARQIFWRVEVPLALPVLLAGLRITTVQAIGLTTVAALIGAGGFGAIMFQGLLSSAIDLVLLGVAPVIALAVAADALFKLLVALVAFGEKR
ncbi:ABC transporter permease [Amantichitinum ursilacus]|uniref:ABC transporter permease n=1 Tax=Amantichitinum ursilacus TaxID=857265 RepID=UPI001F3286AC|nr:ABC transporter permease [Amantichitinum ursilacus]